MNALAQHEILRRLDKAMQAFFRRVKAGETAGFPRFHRYDPYGGSLTWAQHGNGCRARDGQRLDLQGVGNVKLRWHRPLPADSRVTQVTVNWRAGRWYAVLCLELPAPDPLPATGREVGIDMGVRVFATLSTGEQLPGADALRRVEKALLRSQRNVTRKATRQPPAPSRPSRARSRTRARPPRPTHPRPPDQPPARRRPRPHRRRGPPRAQHGPLRGRHGRAARHQRPREGRPEPLDRRRRLAPVPHPAPGEGRRCRRQVVVVPAPGTSQACSTCGTYCSSRCANAPTAAAAAASCSMATTTLRSTSYGSRESRRGGPP